MSAKVSFTAADRKRLLSLCHDQTKWSDGGNWIGIGQAPNCFQQVRKNNCLTVDIKFPTDDAAFRWNDMLDKEVRINGHIGTAGLTVAMAFIPGGIVAGILLNVVMGVAKDELQAMIKLPKVARGWWVRSMMAHELIWTPQKGSRNVFEQTRTTKVYNHQGIEVMNLVGTTSYLIDGSPGSCPVDVADQIVSIPSRRDVITFH